MSLRTFPLITHPAYLRYVERTLFENAGLAPRDDYAPPRVDKIQDVAEYLKISPHTVRMILINPGKHYRSFELKKKAGGRRTIQAPRLFLKVIQWWMKDTILDVLPVDSACHGFVRGRSFITNARAHVSAKHVLCIDIKDCFDSTDAVLVEKVFQRAGYSAAVSLQMAALCSLDGALPQGAPTSPGLLNQVLVNFDCKIRKFCGELGITYTRYADDLSFSSQKYIDLEVLERVTDELKGLGFEIKKSKTRFMGKNDRKVVTGLVLGEGRVNLPHVFLNGLRGWIGSLEQKEEISSGEKERLRGTLALLAEVGGAKSEGLIARGSELLKT